MLLPLVKILFILHQRLRLSPVCALVTFHWIFLGNPVARQGKEEDDCNPAALPALGAPTEGFKTERCTSQKAERVAIENLSALLPREESINFR